MRFFKIEEKQLIFLTHLLILMKHGDIIMFFTMCCRAFFRWLLWFTFGEDLGLNLLFIYLYFLNWTSLCGIIFPPLFSCWSIYKNLWRLQLVLEPSDKFFSKQIPVIDESLNPYFKIVCNDFFPWFFLCNLTVTSELVRKWLNN